MKTYLEYVHNIKDRTITKEKALEIYWSAYKEQTTRTGQDELTKAINWKCHHEEFHSQC